MTFPDGTFFQAGVVDSDNDWGSDKCSTGFATFETALYGNSHLFADLYNIDNCGYSGDHYFTLIRDYSSTSTLWVWKLNGVAVGPTLIFRNFTNQTFQKKRAYTASEIVYVGDIPGGLAFPTVHYPKVLQFKNSSAPYADPSNGHAVITDDRAGKCQYAIKPLGNNDVVTGKDGNINPATCYPDGAALW